MSTVKRTSVSAHTWINSQLIVFPSFCSPTLPTLALVTEEMEDAHDSINLHLTDVELLLCRAIDRAGLMLGNQTLYEWQDGCAFLDGYGLQLV